MEKTIFNILDKLESKGYEAYIVGGYVRNFLLKRASQDIDITTSATPKEVIEILKEENPTTYEYGNIFIKNKEYDVEITTMREEYNYIDNRRPNKIKYITDLKQDLLRRDFTINTICMDKNGKIIDLLNGIQDIKKKTIKMVGNPKLRLKEDALRILRAVRFAANLNFKIEDSLKEAIKENKEYLKQISYERKKEELTKIFTSDNKKYVCKLLKELELEGPLELKNIENILKTNDIIGIYATVLSDNYPRTKTEKKLTTTINTLLQENLKSTRVWYDYGIYPLSIAWDIKGLNKRLP